MMESMKKSFEEEINNERMIKLLRRRLMVQIYLYFSNNLPITLCSLEPIDLEMRFGV